MSFPNQTKELKKLSKSTQSVYLGDIIINVRKINLSSILFKKKFDILWIHGLLHLFGYNHKSEKGYKIMNKMKKFLKRLN